jgi:hypothetical protein
VGADSVLEDGDANGGDADDEDEDDDAAVPGFGLFSCARVLTGGGGNDDGGGGGKFNYLHLQSQSRLVSRLPYSTVCKVMEVTALSDVVGGLGATCSLYRGVVNRNEIWKVKSCSSSSIFFTKSLSPTRLSLSNVVVKMECFCRRGVGWAVPPFLN